MTKQKKKNQEKKNVCERTKTEVMDPSTILMDDPFFDILKRCERNKTKTQKVKNSNWNLVKIEKEREKNVLIMTTTTTTTVLLNRKLCGDDNENLNTIAFALT